MYICSSLEKVQIIYDHQIKFCQKYATFDAVVELTECMKLGFDYKKPEAVYLST